MKINTFLKNIYLLLKTLIILAFFFAALFTLFQTITTALSKRANDKQSQHQIK